MRRQRVQLNWIGGPAAETEKFMNRLLQTAALVGLIAVTARAETFIDLRPKWEKGQEIRYVLTQHADNTTGTGTTPSAPKGRSTSKPGGGASNSGDQKLDQEITFVLRVKETDPEAGATVEMVYEKVKLKLAAGETTIDFDSSKPPKADDPMAAALGQLAGTTMTIKLDASGNITSVTGGGDTLGLGALLGQQGGSLLPKDALGSIIPTSGKKDGQAKLGETWTNVDEIGGSLLGGFKMRTTHKVDTFSRGIATVSIHGGIEPGSEGDPSVYRIKGASTNGSYQWNTTTGQLDRMEMTQNTEIESDALGTKTRMTSTSTTTVQRQGASDAPKAKPKPERPSKPRTNPQ